MTATFMLSQMIKKAPVKYFQAIIDWFYENYIVLNTGKCMDKDVEENKTLQISSQQKMINRKEVEILRIKIDRKLSLHQHVKSVSKKAGH